jgi:excisionase family DNA binding protein
MEPDMSVKQVAAEIGVVELTVRRLLNSGELKGYKLGRKTWRITRAELDQFKERGGVRRPGRPGKDE